jgi:hypothetical protein
MEALEPGKPLSFLEHRIQCGNSLLGATPALLAKGIPDEAFTPIEGEDKEICREFKRVNRDERNKQMRLFAATTEPWQQLGNFAASLMNLDTVGDDSIEAIREKERMYEEAIRSGDYLDGRFWADAWCAAFVWKKTREFSYPITEEIFRRIERNPHACEPWMRREIERLAAEYRFFHWHLAFPDVFKVPAAGEKPENAQTGWNGGFHVVLGNPPWERIKLQEKEWFAARHPEIATAPNKAARERLIRALRESDPALHAAFHAALRQAEGESVLVRNTGRYPLCGVGDINTYAVFAECGRALLHRRGRMGMIVPSGIATDNTTRNFFASLVGSNALVSLYDFENRDGIFEGVHRSYKFSLLTITGAPRPKGAAADFFCFAHSTADLADPHRHFTLTTQDIALINPNTRTCPIFRTQRDAEITKGIYRRVPVLVKEGPPEENPWGIRFMRMFDMSNDSHLFRTREQLEAEGFALRGNHFVKADEEYVPLYEAKMMHQYTHRFGDYAMKPPGSQDTELPRIPPERLADPNYVVLPRYWVRRQDLPDLGGRQWLLGFRDIARSTDERTAIFAVLPPVGANHKTPLIFPSGQVAPFIAALDSIPFDYVGRQSVGGTSLGFFILKQLAVLPPSSYTETHLAFITPRVLELTYTAWDLAGFARDLGYDGPPFRWDEERRFLLRAELDALYFHLYGIARDDVDYILDTFPIVRRKDEAAYGEYRTKRVILEIYDALAESECTGVPYPTRLDPPPADPRVAHPEAK